MSWIAPTVRLVRWWSLLVPVAAALVLGAAMRTGGSATATGALFIAAAITTAAPASLDDPAHELLGAMPTTRRRRVFQRLTIAVPAGTVAWGLAVLAMFGSAGQRDLPTLGALAALGVAVTCVAARSRPDAAAAIGVATPMVAAASHWLLPTDDRLGSIGKPWLEHPLPTIIIATVVAIVATTDPAASLLKLRSAARRG